MRILKIFLTFFVFTIAIAVEHWEPYTADKVSFYGCGNYIRKSLSYGKKGTSYKDFCINQNALGTLMGCYEDVSQKNTENYHFLINKCLKEYNVTINMSNFTAAYDLLLRKGVTWKLLKDRNYDATKDVLNTPVFLNRTISQLYFRGEKNYLDIYTNSTYYGLGAIGYWLMVCIIGSVANWSLIIFPNLRFMLNGPMAKFWRRRVTLPALVCKKQAVAQRFSVLSFLIPSRMESLVSLGFFFLLIAFNAAEIKSIDNDPIFKLKTLALIRFTAVRTGVLSTVLIPLLLLFGGRNNFLMWLTRWKYSTFMAYHRWIGRWVVLMAFLHTLCYTKYFLLNGNYRVQMVKTYIVWGLVAVICGTIILFQGLLYLRRRWYEFFFVLHMLLAVFFVVGTWYHVDDLGYGQFMYASFAVWTFDKVLRAGKLLSFGFPQSQINLLDDRIEVIVPRPMFWNPVVGGYAWLYFGNKAQFWQSHPFTYVCDADKIFFYCKIRSGITYSLFKKLSVIPGGSLTMRVGVDGPYGSSNPIKHHSDVVFVAGGSGLPGLLDEFKNLAKRGNSKQRLVLNWIIKDVNTFQFMSRHFEQFSMSKTEINVYVSQSSLTNPMQLLNASNELDDKCDAKVEATDSISKLPIYPGVNFFFIRPDTKNLVEEYILEASNSVAFVCCGPPGMVDDLRWHVVQKIDETKKRVDFYDTLEVWT